MRRISAALYIGFVTTCGCSVADSDSSTVGSTGSGAGSGASVADTSGSAGDAVSAGSTGGSTSSAGGSTASSGASSCAGGSPDAFWEEDFESDLAANWFTSDPAWSNPKLSTDLPHAGASSLEEVFTGKDSGNFMDRYHDVVDEAWTRFYYYTIGFTYDPVMTKLFYHQADLPNSGYPNFVAVNQWGSRELGVAGQLVAEACGTDGSGPVNAGYDSCNYYPNAGHVPFADGQWYCVETHFKMNTPGVADGALEVFVDGTPTLDYQNRLFRGPDVAPSGNSAEAHLNMIRIYVQSGVGTRYIDDFAVGPSRICCR